MISILLQFQPAQRCLLEFKSNPDSWTRVATILEQSTSSSTRFFGLQILEDAVKYRWKGLPTEEHEGIREYVYSSILGAARQPNGIHEQRVLVSKLDSILVQILKHEWIEGWGSFIPQVISDGNDNEDMCENTMNILLLLSEEIFEFAQGEMVLERTRILRNQYEREFSVVFEFCMKILHHGTHPSLVISTLKCLEHFVTWISWAFLFNSDLIDILVNKMIPIDEYRIHALRCLAEIAAIGTDGQYNMKLRGLFMEVANMLPKSIIDIVSHGADDLSHGLAMFFTSFLRHHWKVVVSDDCTPQFFAAHRVLVELTSLVDQPVVFKICLDYWHYLSSSIHNGSWQKGRSAPDRTALLHLILNSFSIFLFLLPIVVPIVTHSSVIYVCV
jgi:exportin-1